MMEKEKHGTEGVCLKLAMAFLTRRIQNPSKCEWAVFGVD